MMSRRPKKQQTANTPYHASEELYQALFEQAADGIFIADAQGRYIEVNRRGCEMLGYTREEILDLSIEDLIPPEDLAADPIRLDDLRAGKTVLKERHPRRKDGRLLSVEISAQMLANGNFLGIVRDISERKRTEDKLRQTTEELQRVMASVSDCLWSGEVDEEGNWESYYYSPVVEKITGRPPAFYLNKPQRWLNTIHPDDQPRLSDTYQRILSGQSGQEEEEEYRIVRPDGTICWVRDRAVVTRLGTRRRIYRVISDITEHKRAEETLRASEERLQLALDAAQMGQWDWNIVTGEVVWSPQCLALYGLPPDTPMNYERFLQALHPEDRGRIDTALRRAVEDRTSYDELKRTVWPDGSIHWTASRGQVYYDATGQPIRMTGVTFDISKWKEAEEALQKSHEELRAFFSQTIDGCFFMMLDEPVRWDETTDKEEVLDYIFAHQHITQINEAMLAQYGATREQMLSLTPNDFFKHNLAHGRDLWRQLFNAGKIRLESDERKLDGTPMWIEGEYIALYDSAGRITGHFGIQREITERKRAEEELHRSNDLLRAIIEAAPTAIIGLDLDGNVQMVWNPAAEKMLGWSAQEAIGRPLPSVPVESQEEFRRFRERIRSGLTLDGVEVRRQRRDGSPIDYSIYASPLRDAEGQITGNIAVLVDMTERKQAEESLRDSERRLAEAQRIAHIGYWERDYEAGRITLSDEACRIFGLLPQDIPLNLEQWHQRWLDLIHPEDQPRIAQAAIDALENGPPYNVEYRVVRPSGEVRFIHSEAIVKKDEAGRPRSMLGMMQDITERKQAEDELRVSEARFRIFVDHAADAFYLHDAQGTILDVNRQACESLGYSREELIGMSPYNFDVGTDHSFIDQMNARLDAGEVIAFDTQHRRKDGSVFPVEVRVRPFWQGERRFGVSLARDITERKKAEMQTLASEQLFRALVENSPDFIARYDREFRRIYVNPAIQKLFGQPMDNVLNKTPADQSPVYAPQIYIDQLRQVIETATERAVEMPFRTAQGEMHWGHMRFVPEFGPDGQVASVLAIGRDIHEIKENEQRFRTLAENFPDFVVRFDRDCRFTYVNPAVEKAFGMPAEAFLGKTLQELPQRHQPEQNDALMALIRRAFDEAVPNNSEAHWDTQIGKRIFEIRHVPEKDATGNVVTVLGIAHDITERKRAEEERLAHLRFLESMDQVNRAMQGTDDLEQMMRDVLDVLLAVFECDRTWLVYPCDPEAATWQTPMERTRPEYPGVLPLGVELPLEPVGAEVFRILRAAGGPVQFGPKAEHPVPAVLTQVFSVQSFIALALYPKVGLPWSFGLHQCSHPRVWTPEEERLLQEIGRRLADALTSLLAHRHLQESEERYRLIAENTVDTISVFDLNLKPIYVSPSVLKLRGYTVEEAMTQSLDQVLTPESLQKVKKVFAEQLALEASGTADPARTILLELEEYRKDGSTIWVELAASAIRDNNLQPTGILTVSRDITERKQAQEALTLFRSLIDHANDIIEVADPETGRFLDMNERACLAHGYTREEYLALTVPQINLVVAARSWKETVEELRRTGSLVRESQHRRKDGSTFPVEVNINYIRLDRDYVLSVVRDITERKQADEALRASEERYRALFYENPSMFFTLDAEGTVISVNDFGASQLGYTKDELEGQSVLNLFYEEDKAAVSEQLKTCLQTPWQVYHWQFRKIRKDGSLMWVEEFVRAVNGPDGAVYVLVVCQDISERKRAEEALTNTHLLLEQALRFTEALLSAIPTPVFYKDREGRYLGCNRAFSEIMGVAPEEIKGKTVFELWPSEYAAVYHDKDLELMNNPARQVYEFKVRDKDGLERPVIYVKDVFRDENDQVAGIVGAFLDITERKQAEEEIRQLNQELEQRVFDRTAQLEAANKELEAFAYSVSHDLRAPLRHIDGFLELLQERMAGTLDERSRHYMANIADSARRMGALIDDLLAFSRMGRYELSKIPVDLAGLVQEIIQEFAPEMQGRTIRWNIADLPTVTGDRAMLRLALVNLLSNALKFTRGRPQVDIEIGCQMGKKETTIFIRDNGVGFDMAYADKLFGVFQRLHRADEFEGTGIGLANVRRIITRHGGRVWAEGKVDQGATFYFALPK